MKPVEGTAIGQHQCPCGDRVGAASQPVAVDEFVGKEHDILVHPVLIDKVNDGFRMSVDETSEQGNIKSTCSCVTTANLGYIQY
jgi:hypothetical protein